MDKEKMVKGAFPDQFGNVGMSLLDYFAAKAMQARATELCSYVTIARLSYEQAEAMMSERKRRSEVKSE